MYEHSKTEKNKVYNRSRTKKRKKYAIVNK